jgi:hypothetical protein
MVKYNFTFVSYVIAPALKLLHGQLLHKVPPSLVALLTRSTLALVVLSSACISLLLFCSKLVALLDECK